MTIRIKLNGQEIVSGDTAADVVTQMSLLQWPAEAKTRTIAEYMKGVAARVKKQHDASVRNCCAEHFLDDMIKRELIEVMK